MSPVVPIAIAGAALVGSLIVGKDTEDSTELTTSTIMNWEKKTCMTKVGQEEWDNVQLKDCNENDNYQRFVYNSNGTISNGNLKLITWSDNVNMENKSGSKWEFNGTRSNNNFGETAISNGPFRIKIKSNQGVISTDKRSGSNPLALRIAPIDTNDESQVWIANDLYKKCKTLGLDINNCNLTNVNSGKNCATKENVNTPECKTWCTINPGKCDTAVKDYCSSNKMDMDFCGCYNFSDDVKILQNAMTKKGQALKPSCNITSCASNVNAHVPLVYSNSSCPDQIVCLQGLEIGGNASGMTNVSFECGSKPDNDNDNTSSDTGNNNNNNVIAIGSIVIILVVIIAIVFIVLNL
jgi:hypothetical protein